MSDERRRRLGFARDALTRAAAHLATGAAPSVEDVAMAICEASMALVQLNRADTSDDPEQDGRDHQRACELIDRVRVLRELERAGAG